jgi:HK97 family phage major capsid protein
MELELFGGFITLIGITMTFKYRVSLMKIRDKPEVVTADYAPTGFQKPPKKTASKPRFRQLELNLHKCVVLIYCIDELLDDAVALDSYIRKVAPEEIAFTVEDAIVRGSGAGVPLGILTSGCLVTQDKESGQSADTVQYENVLNMWSRMPMRNRKNAIWCINQDIEPQLYTMGNVVSSGGDSVFAPGGNDISKSPYSSLFGRPIVPIEQASPLGDQGDIILADMSQYLLVDRGSIQTDVSIHCRFIYDESVFRLVYRVDGMPKRSSTITAYKGANSLSPFVTLQART